MSKLESMLEQKLNVLKHINVLHTRKRKAKSVSRALLYIKRANRTVWNHNTMPLPVHLNLLKAKTLLDQSMVQMTKF